jgi:hypothetical protein
VEGIRRRFDANRLVERRLVQCRRAVDQALREAVVVLGHAARLRPRA